MAKAILIAALSILLLATSTTNALRFRLHHDSSPTCFEMEINEYNRGGTVRVRYMNNLTVISRSSGDHTASFMASQLRVDVYAPKSADTQAEGEKNKDFKAVHHFSPSPTAGGIEKAKVHSMHIDPVPLHGGVLSFLGLGGAPEPLFGTYEVCFGFVKRGWLLSSMLSNHIGEEGIVIVDVFAGEVYTEHVTMEKNRQYRSAETQHQDHLPEHNQGVAKQQKHEKALAHITENHIDQITGSLHNVQRLLQDAKREVEDLTKRHARFRETSEDSFTRVWGFSLLTMAVMAVSCARQYFAVRNTLKAKKLV